MCGIVGYVGARAAAPILLEGLHRLEYRGYDSAGIATVHRNRLHITKCKGKVRDLAARTPEQMLGTTGIAHTRWATHGEPSDANAHPHADPSQRYSIVHNGIIENASTLKSRLQQAGARFQSETDSEVVAHLIATSDGATLEERVRLALTQVVGTYGLAVIDAQEPNCIVVARNGSPVALGIGDGEMFVASDAAALVRHTQRVVHLDDGELATIKADAYQTSTLDGGITVKEPAIISWSDEALDKGSYSHFMLKEIEEQAAAVRRTLSGRLDTRFQTAHLGGIEMSARELLEIKRIKILGCGSALIAGTLGAQMIEQLARIPAHAEAASEFRYRNPVIEQDTLYIAVSQSGETFDTLAAIQEVKRKGGRVLGIVNVVGSTIARECGRGIYLHAGPEIAVVSTKTFTCTAVAFALLAMHLGRIRDLGNADGAKLISALTLLSDAIDRILAQKIQVQRMAEQLAKSRDVYFVGRAAGYAIALEGALKLKEVSYLHAEAYPASELKHGPLALISAETPTVVVMPHDDLMVKNMSTISEVKARRGPVFAITQAELNVAVNGAIAVPKIHPALDPILLNIPLQLLAFYVALQLGVNIDQPRNLAKSVTVE